MKTLWIWGFVALALSVSVPAHSIGTGTCEGSNFNPIDDVDWNNMNPITMGGAEVASGPAEPIMMGMPSTCSCGGPLAGNGIGMTYWEPMYLVEVTPKPGCFSTFDGEQVLEGYEDLAGQGGDGRNETKGASRLQIHWMRYPIFPIVNMAAGLGCLTSGGFNIGDMSELHDWWQDDMWSVMAYPETLLFVNPLVAISCAIDGITATITGLPIDLMPWCVGHQGPTYPLSGNVQTYSSPLGGNLHALGKYIQAQTRNVALLATIGPTAQCGASWLPFMIKGQYRMDYVEPIAADGTIVFGQAEEKWGLTPPLFNATRTDSAYMLWVGRQCCDIPFLN